MPKERIYDTYDASYSACHRTGAISRYLSWDEANRLYVRDIDHSHWVEYTYAQVNRRTLELPTLMVETAIDTPKGRKNKHKQPGIAAIRHVAFAAVVPFMICLYERDLDKPLPCKTGEEAYDIRTYRCRLYTSASMSHLSIEDYAELQPEEDGWRVFGPVEYAHLLVLCRESAIALYHDRMNYSLLAKKTRKWAPIYEIGMETLPGLGVDSLAQHVMKTVRVDK